MKAHGLNWFSVQCPTASAFEIRSAELKGSYFSLWGLIRQHGLVQPTLKRYHKTQSLRRGGGNGMRGENPNEVIVHYEVQEL